MTTDPSPDAEFPTSIGRQRRWAALLIPLLTLLILVYVGRQHLGELDRLAAASPQAIAAMLVVFVLSRIVHALVVTISLAKLDHTVGLGEMYLLTHIMSYTNLVLPRMGLSAPALYLKHRHGVSYATCSSLLLPGLVLHVVSIGLVGLACQALLHVSQAGRADLRITALFAAVLAAGVLATVARVRIPDRWNGRIAGFFRRLMDAWGTLGSSWSLLGGILMLRVALIALNAVRLFIAFRAVGADVTFVGVFVSSLLAELTMIVSFTPAGLGLREAVVAFSAYMLNCTPATALSAAVLDRIVMTVCIIAIAQIGMWRLVRPLARSRRATERAREE